MRKIVEFSGIESGDKIVDLACGTGLTTEQILEREPDVSKIYAVDFSRAMLDKARDYIDSEKVGFINCRAENLADCISEKIDKVICNSAFWQFNSYNKTLQEIAEILVEDGNFVFSLNQQFYDFPEEESHRKEVVEAIFSELEKRGYSPETGLKDSLTKTKIVELAEENGFQLEKTDTNEFEGATLEDSVQFFSIPAVAPFFEQVPQQEKEEILKTVFENLKDEFSQESKNKWIYFKLRKI